MNKKRYTTPQMETLKVETQGFIASSGGFGVERGSVTYGDDGKYDESVNPTVNESGNIFGD